MEGIGIQDVMQTEILRAQICTQSTRSCAADDNQTTNHQSYALAYRYDVTNNHSYDSDSTINGIDNHAPITLTNDLADFAGVPTRFVGL